MLGTVDCSGLSNRDSFGAQECDRHLGRLQGTTENKGVCPFICLDLLQQWPDVRELGLRVLAYLGHGAQELGTGECLGPEHLYISVVGHGTLVKSM